MERAAACSVGSTNAVSMERIEKYVQKLRHDFIQADRLVQRSFGALTVEVLLQRVWAALYGSSLATSVMPDTLPFSLKDVPTLHGVAALQARITSRVTAAVATRPIVTIYDLEQEICEAEDVRTFAELGLGYSLQLLPITQQVFKIRCDQQSFPVASRDVIDFILHHPEAEHLLCGSGDARDLINLFARHYRPPDLHRDSIDAEGDTSDSTGATRVQVYNTRGMGIHIQKLSSFISLIHQECADSRHLIQAAAAAETARVCRNAPLYRKVVESLDRALANCGNDERCCITFEVSMSEENAMQTSIPFTQWAGSSVCADSEGGVRLRFSCGEAAAAAGDINDNAPHSAADRTEAVSSDRVISRAVNAAEVTALARRRRGGVTVTAAPVCVVEADSDVAGAASPPTRSAAIAPPLGFADDQAAGELTDHRSATALGEPTAEGTTEEEPYSARLRRCADDFAGLDMDDIIDMLSGIPVGTTVELAALFQIFEQLAERCNRDEEARELCASCSATPLIPLIVPGFGTTATVVDVGSPEEVCWMAPSGEEIDSACRTFFGCHIGTFYGSSLRTFFCDALGVPLHPTTRSWLKACEVNRRRFTRSSIDGVFTERFVRLMESCLLSDYRAQLSRALAEGVRSGDSDAIAAEVALRAVVDALPPAPVACNMAVLPIRGAWRRGVDGVFYGGSHFFGASGGRLVCRDVGAPELDVLPFSSSSSSEPHFIVKAVLGRLGVRPLDECVRKRVIYCPITPQSSNVVAAELHCKVAAVAPYVQWFLQTSDRPLYHASYAALAKRLKAFSVVVAHELRLMEDFHYMGHRYHMKSGAPLLYVAQHNTLYGDGGEWAPSVVAEAVLPIFLPLTPEPAKCKALLDFLSGLFRFLSSAINADDRDGALAAMQVALAEESRRLPERLQLHKGDGETDITFTTRTPPSSRFQSHYPSGADGLTLPTLMPPCSFDRYLRERPTRVDATSAAAAGAPLRTVEEATFLPDRFSITSLPQWDNPLYDSVHEELQGGGAAAKPPATQPLDHREPSPRDDEDDGIISFRSTVNLRKRGRGGDAGAVDSVTGLSIYQPQAVDATPDTVPYAVAAEKFVYERLCDQYRKDSTVHVAWMNKEAERGTPYDIVIARVNRTRPSAQPEVLYFVEVKSTNSESKRDFEISLRELLFAARFGRAYRVHRVFGASTSALRRMRVQEYSDIVRLWYSGQLTLTGDVRVLPSF